MVGKFFGALTLGLQSVCINLQSPSTEPIELTFGWKINHNQSYASSCYVIVLGVALEASKIPTFPISYQLRGQ